MKPWQRWNGNQWRAIRNMSMYWFARLILEKSGSEALGFSSHIHPAEVRAIQRDRKKKLYWKYRNAGMTCHEAMARVGGRTVAAIRENQLRVKRNARARWAGEHTKMGTEAYNRWVLAQK